MARDGDLLTRIAGEVREQVIVQIETLSNQKPVAPTICTPMSCVRHFSAGK